jgi:hypothetical protein
MESDNEKRNMARHFHFLSVRLLKRPLSTSNNAVTRRTSNIHTVTMSFLAPGVHLQNLLLDSISTKEEKVSCLKTLRTVMKNLATR